MPMWILCHHRFNFRPAFNPDVAANISVGHHPDHLVILDNRHVGEPVFVRWKPGAVVSANS